MSAWVLPALQDTWLTSVNAAHAIGLDTMLFVVVILRPA